jgi:trk system potassium uptake protein TrkH
MILKKLTRVPERVILFSVFFTIFIGTSLLALPIAQTTPISLIDLFFTATSATCVTGLLTIPLDNFTHFGKCVILVLIQIGGIGLITLTLFIFSLFVNMGLATQLIAGKILEFDNWHNIKKFIIFIMFFTFGIELIGASCIFPILLREYPVYDALFLSAFHAISSFCNAGFSLFHGNMQQFSTNYAMLGITAFLVFCGSFGFIAWHELYRYFTQRPEKKRFVFSLLSKIIMYGSLFIIIIFASVFFILEHNNALAELTTLQAMANSLFHAIVLRSVGFLAIPVDYLHSATFFFIMIMAYIGSAPGSTGSGIKLTILAIFLATLKTTLSGRSSVEIQGRTIAKDQVYKAVAIVALSIAWICATTFFLLITEHNGDFMDLFIEAISGFTNLGLSTGTTPFLSSLGKLFIMLSMIAGRIGSLTFILALRARAKSEHSGFSYPEERVMLS